ncbi:MAG TPA: YceI family protein [Verrucomicrobiae bacterium]|nr:YceI family protein [Verrucomicrobiae bacterium]
MKNLLIAVSLFAASIGFGADPMTKYDAKPGSKVTLDGTSSVHDWTVESTIIGGSMELGFDPANPTPGKVPAKVTATIPVRSLKSKGKLDPKRMEEVMQETMKMQAAPKIEYRLSELVLKSAPKTPTEPLQFDSKGELSMAGVTNKISMPVTMERLEGNKLKTKGNVTLKMTSFGMKPPAPKILLGMISTGDDVKVAFEWLTQKAEAATASAAK